MDNSRYGLILLVYLFASLCTGNDLCLSATYLSSYEGFQALEVRSIKSIKGNSFIVVTRNTQSLMVSEVSTNGTQLWMTSISRKFSSSFDILPSTDGYFILASEIKPGVGLRTNLIKISFNGELLFVLHHPDAVFGMTHVSNGGGWLISGIHPFGGGECYFYRIAENITSNKITKLWNLLVVSDDAYYASELKFVVETNQGFIGFGKYFLDLLMFIQIDSLGNITNSFILDSYDTSSTWSPVGLISIHSGVIFVAQTSINKKDWVIGKIDEKDGSLTFIKSFGMPNGSEIVTGCYGIDDEDAFFVVGHTNSIGAGGFDVLLAKISGDGNIIWAKTYGTPKDEFGFDVILTETNLFVFGTNLSSSDVSLMALDIFGDTKGICVQQTSVPWKLEQIFSLLVSQITTTQSTAGVGLYSLTTISEPITNITEKMICIHSAVLECDWNSHRNSTGCHGFTSLWKLLEGNTISESQLLANISGNELLLSSFDGFTGALFLIDMDFFGNLFWSKRLSISGNFTKVISTNSGNFLVINEITDSLGSSFWSTFSMIDRTSGNSLWSSQIHSDGNGVIYDLIHLLSDGAWILIGKVDNGGFGDYSFGITKITDFTEDGGFEVLKTKSFNTDDNFIAKKIAAANFNESGFLILGEGSFQSSIDTFLTITQIDKDLNIVWNQRFELNEESIKAVGILKLPSGFIFVAQTSANGTDWLIGSISENGNANWIKTFGNSKTEDIVSNCFALPYEDALLVVGSSKGISGNYNAILAKINGNGEVVFAHQYGSYQSNEFGLDVSQNGVELSLSIAIDSANYILNLDVSGESDGCLEQSQLNWSFINISLIQQPLIWNPTSFSITLQPDTVESLPLNISEEPIKCKHEGPVTCPNSENCLENTFVSTFSIPINFGSKIIEDKNGLIIASISPVFGNVTIARISSIGSIIDWEIVLPSKGNKIGLFETDIQEFLLLHQSNAPTLPGTYATLFRSNGMVLFSKLVRLSNFNDSFLFISKNEDEDYLLAGHRFWSGHLESKMTLAKLSNNSFSTADSFDSQWAISFAFSGTSKSESIISVLETEDFNYLVFGTNEKEFLFAKIRDDGIALWNASLSPPSSETWSAVGMLKIDSGLIFFGNLNLNTLIVGMINSNETVTELLWLKSFGSTDSGFAIADGISLGEEDAILLAGTFSTNYDTNVLLLRINNYGKIDFVKSIGSSSLNETGISLSHNKSGIAILCGIGDFNYSEIIITDENGFTADCIKANDISNQIESQTKDTQLKSSILESEYQILTNKDIFLNQHINVPTSTISQNCIFTRETKCHATKENIIEDSFISSSEKQSKSMRPIIANSSVEEFSTTSSELDWVLIGFLIAGGIILIVLIASFAAAFIFIAHRNHKKRKEKERVTKAMNASFSHQTSFTIVSVTSH